MAYVKIFIMDDVKRILRSFTPDEARELMEAALSSSLRDDMRKGIALRKEIEKANPMDASQFLEWLTFINDLCNVKPELRIMPEREGCMIL